MYPLSLSLLRQSTGAKQLKEGFLLAHISNGQLITVGTWRRGCEHGAGHGGRGVNNSSWQGTQWEGCEQFITAGDTVAGAGTARHGGGDIMAGETPW